MLKDGNVHIFEVNPVRAIGSHREGSHSRGNMRRETRGVRSMQSSTLQVEATSAAG